MLIQFSLGLFFFGGLVSANLSGLSSLLNYKNFGKEIVKEALTTFAGNLADEGSGDVCQHFATFLANSLIKKYEKDDGEAKQTKLHLYKFMEDAMTEYRKQNLEGLAPTTVECKKAMKVFEKQQHTTTNTKASIDAVRAFLKALDANGDPCAAAVAIVAEEIMTKESVTTPNLTTLIGTLKNIAPKLRSLKIGDSVNSGKLPCIKTATKLFSKYHAQIHDIVDLVGSLGILPEGFVKGFRQTTEAFLRPKLKDEF